MVCLGGINLNLRERNSTWNFQEGCGQSSLWHTHSNCAFFTQAAFHHGVWQEPRYNCDPPVSRTIFNLAVHVYHLSSFASNTLHGGRLLWRQNTHIRYHCVHFPDVLASIMGLLIFMKSEKINVLDYFLWMEMLWFQTPEKTIGKFYKPTFSLCQLESNPSWAEVNPAQHFWLPRAGGWGPLWGRGKESADVHV